jgi:hypothetical protein
MLIGSAYCTEAIGIHPFFGAFLAGLITPHTGGFAEQLVPKMELVTSEYQCLQFYNLKDCLPSHMLAQHSTGRTCPSADAF